VVAIAVTMVAVASFIALGHVPKNLPPALGA